MTGPAGQRRLLALLAIIAASGPGGVSRDRILGLLWPDRDVEHGRGALAQALYHARRVLSCEDVIVGRDDLRLNRERIEADVAEFTTAVDDGRLERAAELYRGPFLDGFFLSGSTEFERWASEQRSRYERQVSTVYEGLANRAAKTSDHGAAVKWRRQRAALDPLDSQAAIQLMSALVAAGDRAGALQHSRVHEVLVRDRLDVPPDPAITRLAQQIRADADRPVPVGGKGAVLPAPEPTNDEPAGHHPIAPTTPPASPGSTQSRSGRRHFSRATFGIAAVLVAVASVTFLTREQSGAKATSTPLASSVNQPVVIAPFRVSGADASLNYLREGMVELLSVRLADDTSARSVDPGAVLRAWRAAGLANVDDTPRVEAVRVAERLGASRIVVGSVVGVPERLVISATVLGVPGGGNMAEATVEGPADSLRAIVDRLAVRLLAVQAGESERIGGHTPSLSALRSFLDGQLAYRSGDYPRAERFYEAALRADSTFGLAAFQLALSADRINDAEQHDRALALAWAEREALSERDAAHLVAFAGPRYPGPSTETEQLAAWQRAVALAPDRAEAWYELGERYFHHGAVLGMADAWKRAEGALGRALALDPAHAPSRRLLALLAARTQDSSALERWARPVALRDSMGELAPFVRWRIAIARDQENELMRLRSEMAQMSRINLRAIAMASQADGVGAADGERAVRLLRLARSSRAAEQLDGLLAEHSLALNQGRPVLALDVTEQLEDAQPGWRAHLRLRVLDALYGEGDTTAARQASARLSRGIPGGAINGPIPEVTRAADECVLAQWKLARGEMKGVEATVQQLRRAQMPRVTVPVGANPLTCAEILEAGLMVAQNHRSALQRVERLDSLMLTGPAVGDASTYAHIVVARLYESLGRRDQALAAIRRRSYMAGWPRYLATSRRVEARLAAAAGDRDRAAELLRRYLALRQDHEPTVAAEVEAARARLRELERPR